MSLHHVEPVEVLLHPDLEQLLHNLTSRLTILTPVPPKIQSSPSPRIILFRQPQESSLAVIVLKVAGPEHPMNCKDILEAILSVLPRGGAMIALPSRLQQCFLKMARRKNDIRHNKAFFCNVI